MLERGQDRLLDALLTSSDAVVMICAQFLLPSAIFATVTILSCPNFTQELVAVATMALFWHLCSLSNIEHRLLN